MALTTKKSSVVILLILLSLIVPGTMVSQIARQPNRDFLSLCTQFRNKLDASLPRKKIPGASAAVVLRDGNSCTAASGATDFSGGRKLTPVDPILAGSIGKTFVAALAMQLVEEGKLGLDQRIATWLGDRPWFSDLPNGNDITVRMLMNHSSGVPNHVDEKSFFPAAKRDAGRDVPFDYLLNFIRGKKPLFPAGRGHSYADTNYILLAMVEEKVTHRTMYDEVASRFLSRLNLDHTTPSNRNLDPAVHGFYENKPVVKGGRLIINPQWEWAGGGFWSIPLDLARWARALYGGEVLNKSTLEEMLNSRSPGDGKNYGLGVEIVDTEWGKSYGHDGEWPGYISIMRYYPEHGVAVALQYNASGTAETEGYGDSIIDDLSGIFIDGGMPSLSDAARGKFETLTLAWLAKVDKRRLTESWDDISPELKAKYTRENWADTLMPLLTQIGALKTRTLKSIVPTKSDLITVNFASSFKKVRGAREVVLLKRGPDEKWAVASYTIK